MNDIRPKVSIVYCAECGYEPIARELAAAIDAEFPHQLDPTRLVAWHDGSFEVMLGKAVVHSMMVHGGFPDPETLLETLRNEIARQP